jgi:hypothetical protein
LSSHAYPSSSLYVITADRIPALIKVLGGQDGDDVLGLLAAYDRHAGTQISGLMTHPDVAAEFSNWHS